MPSILNDHGPRGCGLLVQLTPQGLAEVSQEALRRDEHARGRAKAVFAGSALARRTR